MPQSKLTKTLAVITKKLKWPENNQTGYTTGEKSDKYLNPLLTPPPRSPRSPEDFRNPHRLGHWQSFGWDYTNPVADRYYHHEAFVFGLVGFIWTMWLWSYGPDYKLREWARREAYLRTYKREALGLPLIDRDLIDPERIVLPTEEEIGDYPIKL